MNTLVGAGVLAAAYGAGLGYWSSATASYLVATGVSFALNRRITFAHRGPLLATGLRFLAVNTGVFAVSYGCARPLTAAVCRDLDPALADPAALAAGMATMTILGFIAQRRLVFR